MIEALEQRLSALMEALGQRLRAQGAVREAVAIWAIAFLSIVLAFGIYRPAAKVVATLGFLYLPLLVMDLRGEDYADYGITLRRWREDVRLFLILAAIVTPLYAGGFGVFQELVTQLPPELGRHLAPNLEHARFHFRLPDRFGEWIIDQVFVVALPEEFFYRGFIQSRLRDAWPSGRRFLGARLGKAFWLTAVLFALGHLAIFQFWRLGVFFPALLFGWMRERTGTVFGAALFHAYCNLLALVLQASFFGA